MQLYQYVTLSVFLLSVVESKKRTRSRKGLMREKYTPDIEDDEGSCQLQVTCKNVNVPVKLPIRGPKGPPGAPGKKGERGLPGTPGVPGTPGKSAAPVPRVAFFAGLRDNIGPFKKNTDLLYDVVLTNIGGAYDTETGRFTAPYNGTYQFTVVVAAQGQHKSAVMLIAESRMIFKVWAESYPTWATSSNTAILSLKQGERVWQTAQGKNSYLHGYMYSTFSGSMLFADED